MGENQIERHGNFDKQFEYLNSWKSGT